MRVRRERKWDAGGGEQSGVWGLGSRRVCRRAGMAHFTIHWQGKLQKHQAFEAEVQANSGAIVKLDETGNLMISEGHFASETIRVSWGLAGMMACLSLAGGWVWVNAYPCVWVPEEIDFPSLLKEFVKYPNGAPRSLPL